jgi:hypothetical protein
MKLFAAVLIVLNMIGVHPACVLKMLVFCNPSIHFACQVYHHFIVTTCFGHLGPSSGD